jgi:hypothetical protein
MSGLVDRPKALAGEMGVDLGGGEVRMAEQLLHGPQISPTFEQVRSVGVPEDVWVQGVPIGHGMAVHDAPGIPRSEPVSPTVQEDRVGWAVRSRDDRPTQIEPVPQGILGWFSKGNASHLGALAEHGE